MKHGATAIYIVHFSKLTNRKEYLDLMIKQNNLQVEYITESDIEFREDVFSSCRNAFGVNFRIISMDRSNNSRSIIKSRRVARLEGYLLLLCSYLTPRGIRYLTDNPFPTREPDSILELTLMHFECLRRANSRKHEWILVLEDDALFEPKKLLALLGNLDVLRQNTPAWYNISSGANLGRTNTDPKPNQLGFFRIRPYGTRCSSGYLINRRFITEVLGHIETYGIPNWTAVDVIYQILQRKTRTKVYWQEPPLVRQGSETGVYPSNLGHF